MPLQRLNRRVRQTREPPREREVAQTLVCSQQQGLRITVCAAPVGNRFITTQQNYGITLPLQLVLSSNEACVKLDTNSSPPAEDFWS